MSLQDDMIQLDDAQVLDLYGRAKTNIMLAKMFDSSRIPQDIYEFLSGLNREISRRGLDQPGGYFREFA